MSHIHSSVKFTSTITKMSNTTKIIDHRVLNSLLRNKHTQSDTSVIGWLKRNVVESRHSLLVLPATVYSEWQDNCVAMSLDSKILISCLDDEEACSKQDETHAHLKGKKDGERQRLDDHPPPAPDHSLMWARVSGTRKNNTNAGMNKFLKFHQRLRHYSE